MYYNFIVLQYNTNSSHDLLPTSRLNITEFMDPFYQECIF